MSGKYRVFASGRRDSGRDPLFYSGMIAKLTPELSDLELHFRNECD